MGFNEEDRGWINKCINYPKSYKIMIDNDSVFVTKQDDEDFYYSFNEYGMYFIKQLLNYIGCDADFV